MDIVIRQMDEGDIHLVQEIAKLSWHDTYRGIIPLDIQDQFLAMAYSNESLKRTLHSSYIYLAEMAEGVVGFANFSPRRKDGSTELGAIYLLPEYQGQGIGTALLMHGINQLEAEAVYIFVEKNNQTGLTFYKARGFKKLAEFNDSLFDHEVETIKMGLQVESMTKQ